MTECFYCFVGLCYCILDDSGLEHHRDTILPCIRVVAFAVSVDRNTIEFIYRITKLISISSSSLILSIPA